ncbi:hypothetical protein [Chitinivorax sp. B]|uniref:hypothetical protein n=1 Tax=Chitinivorax sp. B TaxID=2502235 RepID=UPI0010F68A26|nr:hypothetical protein [Chitinivorax sp. B]
MEYTLITTHSEQFLCDRYQLNHIDNHEDLIAGYLQLAEKHPDHRVLLTLDDIDQAGYTSMHTKHKHDLDDTADYDLSSLGPDCFEDGEHQGYLTSKDEFFIREGNFRKHCDGVSLEDLYKKGINLFDDTPD